MGEHGASPACMITGQTSSFRTRVVSDLAMFDHRGPKPCSPFSRKWSSSPAPELDMDPGSTGTTRKLTAGWNLTWWSIPGEWLGSVLFVSYFFSGGEVLIDILKFSRRVDAANGWSQKRCALKIRATHQNCSSWGDPRNSFPCFFHCFQSASVPQKKSWKNLRSQCWLWRQWFRGRRGGRMLRGSHCWSENWGRYLEDTLLWPLECASQKVLQLRNDLGVHVYMN